MPTVTGRATDYITFTRASNATVTDSSGFIEWAGHNLITNSESFDASAWTKYLTTVSANSAVAPNGTTTADKIVEDNTNSSHYVQSPDITPIAGATYTATVYCKPAGRDFAMLQFLLGGVNSLAIVNLTTATFGTPTNVTGSGVYSASDIGNGWVRISVVATAISGSAGQVLIYPASNATTYSYAGDGTSGIYLWGAHLYRSDLGGMVLNPARSDTYYPTTPPNLLGYTEAFDNAAWGKAGTTITANSIVAPNGLQTADLISAVAGSSGHSFLGGATSIFTGTVTGSVYAKAGTHSFVSLFITRATTIYGVVTFNLAAGTKTKTGSSSLTGVDGTITSAGNGWYRLSVTGAGSVDTVGIALAGSATPTYGDYGIDTWTATGTENIYAWGAQLSDSASLDTYSPVYGAAVTSAAYYAPRLDYDPSTLAAKGMLVEEQRSNLQTYSSAFNDSYWGKYDTNITASAAIAPDGTLSAQLAVPTTANATHRIIGQNISSSAVAYTFSLYVKAAGYSNIKLAEFNSGNGTWFNISTGTVGTSNSGFSGTITAVGNGWYRCTVTWTATAGNQVYGVYLGNNTPETITFAGDNSSGLYLYGFQVETGSFATSYIPTGAASATRSGDVASVSTQAFPFSQSAGTFVVAFDSAKSNAGILGDGNASNGLLYASINDLKTFNGTSGLTSANLWTLNALTKAGIAYDSAGRSLNLNAGAIASDSNLMQTITNMEIGSSFQGGKLNGHIRQITYLPRRITSAELIARTA
jgi:hypothetical protein